MIASTSFKCVIFLSLLRHIYWSSAVLVDNLRGSSSAMGVQLHRPNYHHHSRCHTLQTLAAFAFLFFASATVISLSQLGSEALRQPESGEKRGAGSRAIFERFGPTRRALGLGSSPPTCRSKCGGCSPCWPVHMPIHPGLSTPLEYYPEAWRCQCGNKLFMP